MQRNFRFVELSETLKNPKKGLFHISSTWTSMLYKVFAEFPKMEILQAVHLTDKEREDLSIIFQMKNDLTFGFSDLNMEANLLEKAVIWDIQDKTRGDSKVYKRPNRERLLGACFLLLVFLTVAKRN